MAVRDDQTLSPGGRNRVGTESSLEGLFGRRVNTLWLY